MELHKECKEIHVKLLAGASKGYLHVVTLTWNIFNLEELISSLLSFSKLNIFGIPYMVVWVEISAT